MTKTVSLSHLKQAAINAHAGTSFSPEKRGESLINDYEEELLEDVKLFESQEVNEDSIDMYIKRYTSLLSIWIGSKSRIISPMISGPAKFPVRRMEKARRSEDNKYQLFRQWRERAIKAITRKTKPKETYLSEIDRLKAEVASMYKNQEMMKNINAIIRKSKGSDCTRLIVSAGLPEKYAIEIQKPDYAGRKGFAQFSLTNNLSKIKFKEQRIRELEDKEATREQITEGSKNNEYKFDGGVVVLNYDLDRIQVIYDSKPNEEQRDILKKKAFKWSPTNTAWQRQLTRNAIYDTKVLFSVDIPY